MKKIRTIYIFAAMMLVLFIGFGWFAYSTIHQMRGNARVVNYAGIVRGATQKLVKQELQGDANDQLIVRLDSIVNELIAGGDTHNLIALPSPEFIDNMLLVRERWQQIKSEIALERRGEANDLYALSEEYFDLVDATVSAAEHFSEYQARRSNMLLVAMNITLVLVLAVGVVLYRRGERLREKAEKLGVIAYHDHLTQIANRACCERYIQTLIQEPPTGDLAVVMFDMNNLKLVNDHMGHKGGDQLLADFARIIKTESLQYGFVGRYGGDEFLAIFEDAGEAEAERYLDGVRARVEAFNRCCEEPLLRMSYAAGFISESLGRMDLPAMIDEADKRMYQNKRYSKAKNSV